MVRLKRVIKRVLVKSRLLSLAQRLKGAQVVVLRYHSVQDDPGVYANSLGKGIVHSTAAFKEQMEWAARTYEPVTLDDIASAVADERPMPRRGVAVTFDDGYADNLEIVMPVLERLGMRGAFYITVDNVESRTAPWFCRLRHAFAVTSRTEWQVGSGVWRLSNASERRQAFRRASGDCACQSGAAQAALLDRIERELGVEPFVPARPLMLTWDQVRELRDRGHIVGSHTLSHPNLAQVGPDEARIELRESRRRLEEVLGVPVDHFSYPSPILQPHWSPATRACCAELGYRTAVTCTPGTVSADAGLLCLRRVAAPEQLDDFKWAVQSAFLGRNV
jgi:peptidoglycan/xylan/chitin deacetylase (PgdA/CDA1 family)